MICENTTRRVYAEEEILYRVTESLLIGFDIRLEIYNSKGVIKSSYDINLYNNEMIIDSEFEEVRLQRVPKKSLLKKLLG